MVINQVLDALSVGHIYLKADVPGKIIPKIIINDREKNFFSDGIKF
jgi:hypothetical protein